MNDDIVGSALKGYKDSVSKNEGVEGVIGAGEEAFNPSDFFTVLNHILNYEISGVKVGIWLIMLGIVLVTVGILWLLKKIKSSHKDSDLYARANHYLHKVDETHRRNMPLLALLMLVVLVFIEAAGFSYVFSQFLLNDASKNMLQIAMVAGGILISIILVNLTHYTGVELHRNAVLKAIEKQINSALYTKEEIMGDLRGRNEAISLENTFVDKDSKTSVAPILSRIDSKYYDNSTLRTKRFYWTSIFTLITIVLIGVAAMYVRFNVYDMGAHRHHNPIGATQKFDVKTDFLKELGDGSAGGTQNNDNVPLHLKMAAQKGESYKRYSEIEAEQNASYITYGVMMLIFFAIQVIGVIMGVKYSFIGKQSAEAYSAKINYKGVKNAQTH